MAGCGDPAKLVELSMVRMGEGALRYALTLTLTLSLALTLILTLAL